MAGMELVRGVVAHGPRGIPVGHAWLVLPREIVFDGVVRASSIATPAHVQGHRPAVAQTYAVSITHGTLTRRCSTSARTDCHDRAP